MSQNGTGRGASYRDRAKNRVEKTYDVELPSGATFTLRDANLQMFVVSGQLPLAIAEKMELAKEKGMSDAEAFQELNLKEKKLEKHPKTQRQIWLDERRRLIQRLKELNRKLELNQ